MSTQLSLFDKPRPWKAIRTQFEYERELHDRGWQCLGHGSYSGIYAYPNDPDRVLRVSCDDTWEPYVRWATLNGFAGSYAPKVYAFKRLADNLYIASLERLDATLDHAEGGGDTMDALWRATTYSSDPSHSETAYWFLDLKWPGLKCFVKRAHHAGFTGDWRGVNWMVKGPRLVLTDPQGDDRESPLSRWRAVGPTIKSGR